MTQAEQDYQELFKISQHIRTLNGILSLLHWDQETYMPLHGANIRSQQLEILSGMIHQEQTSRQYRTALGKLVDLETGEPKNGFAPPQAAALREWYRDWKRNTALPSSFVTDFARLTSQAITVWRKAKQDNNYQQFAPYLDKIVSMNRKKADYLGWEEHPYDALIDLYEYNVTTEDCSKLFKQLRKPLHELLEKIKSKKQVKDDFLNGKFSTKKQLEVTHQILKDIGYDLNRGRLDLAAHPQSVALHPDDSRITTRIHHENLISNISAVLHECGHSFYDQGLPRESYGSPLGEPISLGMHECQSRFWETRIGQSKPFWKHYLPLLKKTFGGKLANTQLDTFYKGVNKVFPSMIRVDADEVTYPLHIILRFEIEKSLMDGSLNIRDLPEAWNAKMQELLTITPANNSEGCMQDIHWASGAFGYFPSYTLGTIYASHLFKAFEAENPDWEKKVAAGEFGFIREWLNHHVYQHGRRYTSLALLKKATGKKLTSDAFIEYLTDKYTEIYKL